MSERDIQKASSDFLWLIPADKKIDGIHSELLSLVSECGNMIEKSVNACFQILDENKNLMQRHKSSLIMFLISCKMSEESILVLLGNQKVWDAEKILRSVYEATIKFVFLSIGNEEELKNKVFEFDEILPDITRLKRHKRIESFFEIVENPLSQEWKPFQDLLLSEEEVKEISKKYPRKFRRNMEMKWSFHKLIEVISKSNIPELQGTIHMFYNYGMGSNMLHQDFDGISVIWERSIRSKERRESIVVAHASRIISDLLINSLLRHSMLVRLVGMKENALSGLYNEHCDFFEKLSRNISDWNALEYNNDNQ